MPMYSAISALLAIVFLFASSVQVAVAETSNETPTPFRIGTAGSSGTYLPIGSLIAKALSEQSALTSNPLLMLAQRSSGSVTNAKEISSGLLESGLSQANVTHWAYNGTGPFSTSAPLKILRTLATLYVESLHLVVHVDSGINSLVDLAGSRVSVDEVGSGTQLDVEPLLETSELKLTDMQIVYLKPADAMARLREEKLDAFFIVAGYPVKGVAELIAEGKAKLLPIEGESIDSLLEDHPFFTKDTIPANTYSDTQATTTLAVAAQWIVNASLDTDLIYDITKALWQPKTLEALAAGHPKGKDVRFASALLGTSIPLHPGAKKFYIEAGADLTQYNHQNEP